MSSTERPTCSSRVLTACSWQELVVVRLAPLLGDAIDVGVVKPEDWIVGWVTVSVNEPGRSLVLRTRWWGGYMDERESRSLVKSGTF